MDRHRHEIRAAQFNDKCYSVVAKLGGDVVGGGTFRIEDGCVMLDYLAFKPPFQRQGLGAAVVRSLKSLQPHCIVVFATRASVAFYARQGFVAQDECAYLIPGTNGSRKMMHMLDG